LCETDQWAASQNSIRTPSSKAKHRGESLLKLLNLLNLSTNLIEL
jgi:hypothetical protein